jgi:hypothetical protein
VGGGAGGVEQIQVGTQPSASRLVKLGLSQSFGSLAPFLFLQN